MAGKATILRRDRSLRIVVDEAGMPCLAFPDGTIVGNVRSLSAYSELGRVCYVTCEIVIRADVRPDAPASAPESAE